MGVYDVTVSVGPGYQTKRQENMVLLESLMQGPMGQLLTGAAPDLIASIGSLPKPKRSPDSSCLEQSYPLPILQSPATALATRF